MRDKEGAAVLAAIGNLQIGWDFEDPRRDRDDLILRATGPDGDEIEVSGGFDRGRRAGDGGGAGRAWRGVAVSLAC